MNYKILITGVTGFVGKAIVTRLASASYKIVGIGRTEPAKVNLPIEYYRMDIANSDDIVHIMEVTHPDIIIHCAAAISNDNLAKDLIDANVRGTANLVNSAVKYGVRKFIYISSSPIIGMPQECPITEEHPVYPRTTYHLTKYFGEVLLENSAKAMDYVILRIPSPVGVGMPNNKILSVFISKCIKHEDIILLGKGGRMQNYIDVRDIAQAVECSVQSDIIGIYNIAADQSYSNYELAQLCKSVLYSPAEILFNGVDAEEDIKWVYSTRKAKRTLNFSAVIPLEQTIEDIANSMGNKLW